MGDWNETFNDVEQHLEESESISVSAESIELFSDNESDDDMKKDVEYTTDFVPPSANSNNLVPFQSSETYTEPTEGSQYNETSSPFAASPQPQTSTPVSSYHSNSYAPPSISQMNQLQVPMQNEHSEVADEDEDEAKH